jgi:pimeloyl-ACP methyl ester carboxylesterase
MKRQNNYFPEYVKINGIEQYLLHYKTNNKLPVLLFLHGGPGMAESTFAYAFQEGLSKIFNIVYWDQRGAGKTLTKNKGNNNYPSVEELIDDLSKIVRYLKEKYGKEKVAILGHSWGSVLGTLFVLKYPKDVMYYIGAGQVIDIVENEKIGYEKLKEFILKSGNKKDLEKLEKIGIYPEKNYEKPMIKKIQKIRILQGKYKIGMNFIPIIKTLIKSPIFSLSDIFSLFKGMNNNKKLWDFLFSNSLYEESSDYEIPVFYILGERDFQAPNIIASRYFNSINAPMKKIFIMEEAGHFMMLDQTKQFADVLEEICKYGEGQQF